MAETPRQYSKEELTRIIGGRLKDRIAQSKAGYAAAIEAVGMRLSDAAIIEFDETPDTLAYGH